MSARFLKRDRREDPGDRRHWRPGESTQSVLRGSVAAGLIVAGLASAGSGLDDLRQPSGMPEAGVAVMRVARPAAAPEPTGSPPRSLDWIRPGTVLSDGPLPEGSHLVLLARPRLAQGDLDAVPGPAVRYASMFFLMILADVAPAPAGGYVLDRVALGLALDVGGRTVVATSEEPAGAELGLLGRRVLRENERVLRASVHQVARTRTLMVFDVEAIVLRGRAHVPMVIRHAILVDPRTGRLMTLVWLLENRPDGTYALADDAPQCLPPGLIEDRRIDVAGAKFTLGIPAPDAFALVQIPQGDPVAFPSALRHLAAARHLSDATTRQLESELQALRSVMRFR